MSVTLSVVGITATAGQDYTAVEPITFTWADGDFSSRTVTIGLVVDKQNEGEESLTVSLSNATGGAIIEPGDAAERVDPRQGGAHRQW